MGKSTTGGKKKKLNIALGKSFTDTTTDRDTQDEDIQGEKAEDEEMEYMTTQEEDTEPDVSSPIISDGECEESGTPVNEVGEKP